jgi:isocitrate lyase
MSFNGMTNAAADVNAEDQAYAAEVEAVKKWWTDERWRYTKRPFTAEQIVAKRGNLKIEYPSNVQSKKLWKILESRFKVRLIYRIYRTGCTEMLIWTIEQGCLLHLWLSRTHHVDSDGEISGYCLCFWMAIFLYCIC